MLSVLWWRDLKAAESFDIQYLGGLGPEKRLMGEKFRCLNAWRCRETYVSWECAKTGGSDKSGIELAVLTGWSVD